MPNIRVLLADDHTVVRQGLRALLSGEKDIQIVGEAGTGREAVQMAQKLTPDVILMDIAMPLMNGLEATRKIAEVAPSAKVLVLSSYGEDDYVQKLTEAGASGYLIKHAAANDLVAAVRETHKGNAFFSPGIAKRLRDQVRAGFANGNGTKASFELTERELETLGHIVAGKPNKVIACDMGISIKTVEKHRQQVMNKLNIHEVASLTRYAIAKGMIDANGQSLMPNPEAPANPTTPACAAN
ncbi:response regulator [Pedosphaera parvula]|nr:response regulator transcription factor [Pedosphaera parvula]